MKKRFMSKSLIAKIALVLVIVLLLQFAMAEPVRAANAAASLGGTLLSPIVTLVVYLADGVIQILQSALTNIEQSFSTIELKDGFPWSAIWATVAIIVGALLIIAAVVFSGGTAAPIIVAVAAKAMTAGILVSGAGFLYLGTYPAFGKKIDDKLFGKSLTYLNIYITPETLLKNQIQLFNVNYFEKATIPEGETEEDQTDQTISLSWTLRDIVSQFYITVRDIAIVSMLIVMLYVAIRLLLALTPKEKSRYKESIVNCIIGLVLIMGMHYAMALSTKGIEMITNSIAFSSHMFDVPGVGEEVTQDDQGKVDEFFESNPDAYNKSIEGVTLEVEGNKLYDIVKKAKEKADEGTNVFPGLELGDGKTVYIKASNFTEQARYMSQKIYELDADDETVETWEHIGWSFVYIVLVILTLAFVWMYGKRTVYMMLLTIVAPVVGVMYPINRVNGSRAQTLNLWFKEYFGNLIIQPFHLLLYTILIGSAMAFAINNPVFVILAIMGLVYAEGLLKDLLGIRDTKIGSFAKSLQETTRAIKTTEKAATSLARNIGRKVSNGISAAAGYAAGRILDNNNADNSDENGGANQQPREQNNPAPIDENQGANPPLNDPPGAGALNPQELGGGDNNGIESPREVKPQEKKLDEVATMQKYFSEGGKQNADGWYFNPYTDEFDENYNPLTDINNQVYSKLPRGLDEVATMKNYMNDGYGQNAYGWYFNPYTDEYDENYNPLNDTNYRVYNNLNNDLPQELDEAATMQKYFSEGGRQNTDGAYFNPYTDEFDENYNPLNDSSYQLYSNGNTGIDNRAGSEGVLDDDTLSLVDSYNNAERPFDVLDGGNERVIRDDGDREILKDDYGNLHLRPSEIPDGEDPMAMANVVGNEPMSSLDVGMDDRIRNINSIDGNLESNSISNSGTAAVSGSGTTAYGTSGGSQSIPDGSKVRTQMQDENVNLRDNFSVWTNPNEPEPSSGEGPTISVLEGGKGNNSIPKVDNVTTDTGNVRTTTSSGSESGSIPRLNPQDVEVMPLDDNRKRTKHSKPEDIILDPNNFREIPQSSSETGTNSTRNASSTGPGARRTNNNQNNAGAGTNKLGSGSPAGSVARKTNNNQNNAGAGANNPQNVKPKDTGNGGSNNNQNNTGTGTKNSQTAKPKNTGNGGANNNQNSAGTGTKNSQTAIPKDTGNGGTNNNQNNAGAGTNNAGNGSQAGSRNSGANNNQNNAGTGTNNAGSGSPAGSGNSGANNSKNSKVKKVKDKIKKAVEEADKVKIVDKGIDVTHETVKRTANAGASAVERVLGAAMDVATGNVPGAVGSAAGIVGDTVNVALGGTPKRSSSGSSSSSSKSSAESSGSQNVQTIVKATEEAKNAMTVEEARAFEDKCKDKNINNDKTMGLIAAVYQKAPKSDKAKIVKLSAALIKMKQDGKSFDDAINALDKDINANATKELLKDLYKEL